MSSEELFQINQRISQIKRSLLKRQQKFIEWSIPYQKILQSKNSKQYYLGKQTHTQNVLTQIRNTSPQKQKEILRSLVANSRHKINNHYNQLKQLDQLMKKKNKIRVKTNSVDNNINLINKQNKMINKDKQAKRQRIPLQDKSNNNNDSCLIFYRTAKDKINPFQNVKADKFIQLYQQSKKQESNGFKFPGVGLQNTQYFALLKKQSKIKNKKQQTKNGQSLLSTSVFKYKNRSNIASKFQTAFKQKPKTLGCTNKSNIFEDRMKKILKYHGKFWTKDIQLTNSFQQQNA